MRYIETLREGERIQEIYLCRQRTTAMTKTGKEYENVILQGQNRFPWTPRYGIRTQWG